MIVTQGYGGGDTIITRGYGDEGTTFWRVELTTAACGLVDQVVQVFQEVVLTTDVMMEVTA